MLVVLLMEVEPVVVEVLSVLLFWEWAMGVVEVEEVVGGEEEVEVGEVVEEGQIDLKIWIVKYLFIMCIYLVICADR